MGHTTYAVSSGRSLWQLHFTGWHLQHVTYRILLTAFRQPCREAIRIMRSQPAAAKPVYHIFNMGFSSWGAKVAPQSFRGFPAHIETGFSFRTSTLDESQPSCCLCTGAVSLSLRRRDRSPHDVLCPTHGVRACTMLERL